MAVYLILYGMTILFSILEIKNVRIAVAGRERKTRKVSFACIYIYTMLLGIFRSELLGVDSWRYKYYYWERYRSRSLSSVLNINYDVGYGVLNWFIGRFTADYWVFRAILFTICFSLVAIWIYKHSKYVAVSFFIFISFGFLAMDFYLLRLAVAVSIYIWSYDALMKRKAVRYSLITLLASTFHQSALFGLILYPLLAFRKNDFKRLFKILYYFGAAVFVLLGGGLVASLYSKNEYADSSSTGEGYGLLLFYIVTFAVIILYKIKACKKTDNSHQEIDDLLALSLVSIIVQLLATRLHIASRLQRYINPFLFLLIPGIIERSKPRKRLLFTVIIFAFFIFIYFFANARPGRIVPYISHFSD